MSELSREQLLAVVRRVWEERDPVPEGLVARMQAAAAMAASDVDLELMLLVERSAEPAGVRGSAYTLRFVHGETELLLRIDGEGDDARVDGWIVPPEPMTVRAVRGQDADDGARAGEAVVADSGRFALTGLRHGLLRLHLEPHDPDRPAFATPAFEI